MLFLDRKSLKNLFIILMLIIILFFFLPPASTYAQEEVFKTEECSIQIIDKYNRPFVEPPNTSWLGVRLVKKSSNNAELPEAETEIFAQGNKYKVDDNEYIRFPLKDSVANVSFIIYIDEGKNPVDYELTHLRKVGSKIIEFPLKYNKWSAGTSTVKGTLNSKSTAPLIFKEILFIIVFTLLSLLLIYLLFFRSLFSRMLFNARMEVNTAEIWSNCITIIAILVLLPLVYFLASHPIQMYKKVLTAYMIIGVAYILTLIFVYLFGWFLTEKKVR